MPILRGKTLSGKTIAAGCTVAFAIWQLISAARAATAPGADPVGPALELYRSLATDLPASGAVGFLPTSANPTLNTANYYVAQYGLAPRVLLNPFDRQVRFVVTGVDAPDAIGDDPRLNGFELAAIRDRGVRIFRRMDR